MEPEFRQSKSSQCYLPWWHGSSAHRNCHHAAHLCSAQHISSAYRFFLMSYNFPKGFRGNQQQRKETSCFLIYVQLLLSIWGDSFQASLWDQVAKSAYDQEPYIKYHNICMELGTSFCVLERASLPRVHTGESCVVVTLCSLGIMAGIRACSFPVQMC